MKYFVHTVAHDDAATQLAGALKGRRRDVTIYVIGVEDHIALASVLSGKDRDTLTIAQAAKHVESIGKPDGVVSETQLVEFANQRIKQLEASHGSK